MIGKQKQKKTILPSKFFTVMTLEDFYTVLLIELYDLQHHNKSTQFIINVPSFTLDCITIDSYGALYLTLNCQTPLAMKI